MRRAGGHVSPICARLEELLLISTCRHPQQSDVGCGPAVSAIAPAAGGIRGGIGWIWGREGDA
jgi:hypothetical protein